MDKQTHHLLLRVPTPDKHSLSCCEPSPRDLKLWIAGLPKANLGETARQLYQCLIEVNQLVTPPDNRLKLLELLRVEVHFICHHLERHFLNQAIVLDERPRKIANLCQALQNHLAAGYKLIITQDLPQASARERRRERNERLVVALQRATYALCGPLVRANQLYCPVPEGLWLELHQLYQIAHACRLHRLVVRDPLAHVAGLSVEQTYLIALLLGCSRCNQMRQNSIARLAEALEAWTSLARLQDADAPGSIFVVTPQVDGPPRYKTLSQGSDQHGLLGLNPLPLVDAIREYLLLPAAERGQARLPVPEGFNLDLLQHLASAWGDIAERTFQRTPGQGSLTLCIGMSALHYYLAGGKTFSEVLRRPEEAKSAAFDTSAPRTKDIWNGAFDAQPGQDHDQIYEEIQYVRPGEERHPQKTECYPTYELAIVNHSPGGYCLKWPKEVPSQLQAGELLGIQDSPEQPWCIAIVRWIRQVRGGGTQMGIELIAPHAQPCGLQLLRKDEQNSCFLRALLLPEISAISRPATLLAPRLPFQEGNKVVINLNGEERQAVLSRKQTGNSSFNQFEYRLVEQFAQDPGKPVTTSASGKIGGEEDFDSLWKSL